MKLKYLLLIKLLILCFIAQ